MKKHFFLTLLACVTFLTSGVAQLINPVTWTSHMSAQEAKVGDVVELIFEAKIEKGWYLYSSDFDPDLGPIVTSVSFDKNATYELVGGLTPIHPKKKYDDLWEGEISYFKGTGQFQQKVKVLKSDFHVEATLKGQTCSDETGQCIPLEESFAFKDLKVTVAEAAKAKETNKKADEVKAEEVAEQTETTENTAVAAQTEVKEKATVAEPAEEKAEKLSPASKNEVTPVSAEEEDTIWGFMISAFLFGLAAIFTPCVFPMIPLTVSFFTKQEGGKAKALLYGFSIIFIYGLVGAVLAPLTGDPSVANLISTHWLPNIVFFVIFIVFAASFFGAFEITLPSSLVNKMDAQSDRGGLLAVFFMAFTLVLVSFSCTGPIVGTILIQSVGGHVLRPMLGMMSFALAFALPFTLFALFPGLMKSMPKSGGWLNSVKVVLGFIELAFAFKFLSTIDLVYNLQILDKDVMVAIWVVVFSMLGFYLLGKIRLPHDMPVERISVTRLLLSVVVFSFVVYLIPGLFGAPLNLLSGILPPQTHHSFDVNSIIRKEVSFVGVSGNHQGANEEIKWADRFHLPHGLHGYFDYEQALAASKRENKPIFVDFTGHGCANCRKMEDNVWAQPEVLKRLREDYIILALYVDDPTELPEEDWVTSTFDGKVKKTIGAVNFDFQISKFNSNAQPYYCLLDNEGELLIKPKAYDLNVENFVNFLDNGKEVYGAQQSTVASH
ncbi:cytochrome c biogenesis protein CcdA [Limibacter armeniacum]|uniref:cytochrome c biogenesis protein CcdA n=1 Tax=Limibacter armeniacum TaxID=466084 RepID=UPI002FE60286